MTGVCIGKECPMWAVCTARDETTVSSRTAGCQNTLICALSDAAVLATGVAPSEEHLAEVAGQSLAHGSDELAAAVRSLMSVVVYKERASWE